MIPEVWQRRLAKRGLALAHLHDDGETAGECWLSTWTAFVEPRDHRRHDPRFRPLIGVGRHTSRDAALKLAVANFDALSEEQERERALLALAEPVSTVARLR